MAVTAVQTRSGQAAGTTLTVSITTSAGNLLGIVTGTFGANPAAAARSGQSNNVGVAAFQDAGTDAIRGDYMMNIGASAATVTCTGSAGGNTAGCVTEFTGAHATVALGSVNHAVSATTTVQPGSITPTAGSALMTGTNDDGSGTSASTIGDAAFTYTVDEVGGANTVWDENSAVGGTAHTDNVTASATNPTWTTHHTGVAHMTALIMEFLAAGGATGLPPGLGPSLQMQPAHTLTIGW